MSTRHMSLLPPYERLRWRPDVYPHLLRTWRRQVREGRFVAAPLARFMPVRVATTAPAAVGIAPPSQHPAAAETVKFVLPEGRTELRLRRVADRTFAPLRVPGAGVALPVSDMA